MKDILGSGFIDELKDNSLAKIEKDFLIQFKYYVEKRISDPDLNVVDVAKELSLSRVQLYRKVKSLSNYSPNELIRIIRLKKASYLLSTNIPIAEVAYQTGFSSASYFTKCFKEFYGLNPSEY
ncbi:helix-turn-helix domain-containing protein [Bacteroides propionicifaciens]|uniref:helix-turn-helix domain-containing protein n=1 Tax=Bacteroides propionicifaciens TaxID=392838 RepID=UPI00036A1315|nr:helix-turn-helix transcriptional regulator [Bacteroides propionicifaciens]